MLLFTAEGFCKGVKCAENSECVDGRCVCKGGFVGDGHWKCNRKLVLFNMNIKLFVL